MSIEEYFDSVNLLEIERYINEKQEENLSLEFKTVNHPEYLENNSRNFDKKNISKVLSGFANSNGGIVIWGIKAEKVDGLDIASKKKPIKELTKFLNLLNRLEGEAVTPMISGVRHEKLELEGNEDIGYIKSYIPSSENAPHMANYAENHYYKRSGDNFYQCEHYDIIDIFSRRISPKLLLKTKFLPIDNRDRFDQFLILFSIENIGRCIAKYPYLAINTSEYWNEHEYGLDGNRTFGLKRVRNNSLYRYNYSGGADIVVYPESVLDVCKFFLQVEKGNVPKEIKIEYLLTAENMDNVKETIQFSSSEIINQF